MDIVIISEFCEDFSQSDNDRFFYLAKMLADDNKVELVTSSFRHTTKCRRDKPTVAWPFRISFVEEPGYPKNICLKRFMSHYIWGINVKKYLEQRQQPDVIYCAVPSLTAPFFVSRLCKKKSIKFVIDVQDLWPEAFKMVLNIPVLCDIGFAPFKIFANEIYKRADAICGVSNTYVNRALKVNKKCVVGTPVFLGTNLDIFDKYAIEKPILVKQDGEVWLAYCGTLGSSYDLSCVIDALKTMPQKRVKLIVMGDGPRQNEFEQYAKSKNINAIFTGRLNYEQMCSLLCICDIAVNPITHLAAQSIINKHADYAASGIPVVSTQENDEYRNLIDEYEMGFNCKNNDPNDLAKKLIKLIDDKKLRLELGFNARRCAEEKFNRKRTYLKLVNIILK